MNEEGPTERKGSSFDLRALSALGIRILLSALFFYTAIAKLRPIEPFEFTIVETGWIGWDAAWILARAIIGVEFGLATLLLLGLQPKATFRAAFVFIFLLSLHLIVLLATEGNISDCGCLGNAHNITPLQSLLKNLGILALLALLWKWRDHGLRLNFYPRTLFTSFGVLGILLPFVLFPPEAVYTAVHGRSPDPSVPFKMEGLRALEEEKGLSELPEKRILGFLSTSCPYCRMLARKLSIIEERTEDPIPVHLFFSGNEKSLEAFKEESRMAEFPSTILPTDRLFHFAGGRVPAVYLIDGDEVLERYGMRDLDESRIRRFLKEGPSRVQEPKASR